MLLHVLLLLLSCRHRQCQGGRIRCLGRLGRGGRLGLLHDLHLDELLLLLLLLLVLLLLTQKQSGGRLDEVVGTALLRQSGCEGIGPGRPGGRGRPRRRNVSDRRYWGSSNCSCGRRGGWTRRRTRRRSRRCDGSRLVGLGSVATHRRKEIKTLIAFHCLFVYY